jgi:RNA polymerase sigma-70 factor (ECF subfamily)
LNDFLAGVEQRAYRIAMIASRNHEDALDIVQDTMITLAQKYVKKDSTEWTPLFFRILQNTIRDFYRREKVRSRWRVWFGSEQNDVDLIETAPSGESDTPHQQVSNEQLLSNMEQGVRLLPLKQQQVFMLRIIDGMSIKESAKVMKITDGSIKTHLSRALKTLKVTLKDFNYE